MNGSDLKKKCDLIIQYTLLPDTVRLGLTKRISGRKKKRREVGSGGNSRAKNKTPVEDAQAQSRERKYDTVSTRSQEGRRMR